jgi:hypothetical protein
MDVELSEATQALWYLDLTNGNWAGVLDALEDGRFRITHRFRWYSDTSLFDSQDRREKFVGYCATAEKGIDIVREMGRVMQSKGAGKMTELLRGNLSIEDFVALLEHQPFAHTKRMTQAEYEAEYGTLSPDAIARDQRRSGP